VLTSVNHSVGHDKPLAKVQLLPNLCDNNSQHRKGFSLFLKKLWMILQHPIKALVFYSNSN
jgi:hypothetical protein